MRTLEFRLTLSQYTVMTNKEKQSENEETSTEAFDINKSDRKDDVADKNSSEEVDGNAFRVNRNSK